MHSLRIFVCFLCIGYKCLMNGDSIFEHTMAGEQILQPDSLISTRAVRIFLLLCFTFATFILVTWYSVIGSNQVVGEFIGPSGKLWSDNSTTSMFITSFPHNNSSLVIKQTIRKLTSAIKEETTSSNRRHVIINSYMRSGSSFFGELLGFRPDTFYWFELFWGFTAWGFIKKESTVCDSRTCQSCMPAKYASRAYVTKVLRDLFSCSFANMTTVLDHKSPPHSGALWETPECTTKTSKPFNAQQCIMSVENQCKSKPHTVTKILRTTVDMYRDVLIEHEDVMLIQLFRDPRGVVNSRQRTGWYSPVLKDFQSMTNDVKCLCARMLEDYKSGLEFQKKFPGKFMFVVYEDLLSDLPNKLDRLYKKLRMETLDQLTNISEEFKKLVGLHKANPTKTKSKDYEFWWRSSLTLATVQTVDKNCRDIYTAIGYKSFNSEKHLRDLSINSVTVKDAMKI